MITAIQYIQSRNIQDYIQIIKILMEYAEKQTTDGTVKLNLVLDAWNTLCLAPFYREILANVSLTTVNNVIETIIFASKTPIAVNAATGCFSSFKKLFKRKKTATVVV